MAHTSLMDCKFRGAIYMYGWIGEHRCTCLCMCAWWIDGARMSKVKKKADIRDLFRVQFKELVIKKGQCYTHPATPTSGSSSSVTQFSIIIIWVVIKALVKTMYDYYHYYSDCRTSADSLRMFPEQVCCRRWNERGRKLYLKKERIPESIVDVVVFGEASCNLQGNDWSLLKTKTWLYVILLKHAHSIKY